MKKIYFFILISLTVKTFHAQELVPNPSFETYVVCPTAYNQVTACVSWFPAPNNIDPIYGTEYMNACASGLFDVPTGTWGFQTPVSGNGYMAMCLMAPAAHVDYRENIYAKLISTLTIGATYSVSVQISFTDNSKYATNNFGVKFGKAPTFPIDNSCQINSAATVTNQILWTTITGTFVADSAYQYVAVGNFHTDAMTSSVTACPGCSFVQYCYFIDEVSVKKIADPVVVVAPPGACDSYNWATWTAGPSTLSTSGTILCDGVTHSVTMTTNYHFDFTPDIYAYGVFAGFPGALPTNTTSVRTTWSEPPSVTTGSTTICFASPVTNPVLLISSIGNPGNPVPLVFSTDFSVIYDGGGLSAIASNSLLGTEGNCILEFPGVFTCVTIVSNDNEFYANLTWGIKNQTTHSVTTTPSCSGNNGKAHIKIRGSANTFSYSLVAPISTVPKRDSTFTGLAPGTYTYMVQNNVPCSYTGTFVIASSPTPTLITGATASFVCEGNTTTLSVNGADTYTWSTGEISRTITVTPTITTTYTVSGTNSAGCKNTETITIGVIDGNMSATSATICSGETATLSASGASTYTWSTGSLSNSVTVNPSETTTYTVQGIGSSGCKSLRISVVEVANPIAAFDGIDKPIFEFGDMVNLINKSIDATDYMWTFCNNYISPNTDISISLSDTGHCCIELIAKKFHCTDTTTKCYYVNSESYILIPNVFTPNGDNANEVFKIKGVGIKDLNCVIFDRWGLKLYEWNGIDGYWDGKAKTGLAPSGTYYFIVRYKAFKGDEKTEKGFLTLFRD